MVAQPIGRRKLTKIFTIVLVAIVVLVAVYRFISTPDPTRIPVKVDPAGNVNSTEQLPTDYLLDEGLTKEEFVVTMESEGLQSGKFDESVQSRFGVVSENPESALNLSEGSVQSELTTQPAGTSELGTSSQGFTDESGLAAENEAGSIVIVPNSYSITEAEKYFVPKEQRRTGNLGGPPPISFPGGPTDPNGSGNFFAPPPAPDQ
jgi:hypothetical protein